MTYDVYLYEDGSDDALSFGSSDLIRDFITLQEAKAYADRMVDRGHFARAIVGEGEDVFEHYDTGAAEPELLVPNIAPPGPRLRQSGLADRLAA